MEYQKETRKKLIENQYKLKGIIAKVRTAIASADVDQQERKKLGYRLDELEMDGDYKDILAIVELSKNESFAEFKALLKAQESEMAKLSPAESQELKTMDRSQLEATIKELDDQLNVIEEYKQEYMEANEQIEDLEGTHVILSGLDRRLVLNTITYYELMNRHMGGNGFNEDTKRLINDVHYHVEHNLPVNKDVSSDKVASLRTGSWAL